MLSAIMREIIRTSHETIGTDKNILTSDMLLSSRKSYASVGGMVGKNMQQGIFV